jgi:hypothetical protein
MDYYPPGLNQTHDKLHSLKPIQARLSEFEKKFGGVEGGIVPVLQPNRNAVDPFLTESARMAAVIIEKARMASYVRYDEFMHSDLDVDADRRAALQQPDAIDWAGLRFLGDLCQSPLPELSITTNGGAFRLSRVIPVSEQKKEQIKEFGEIMAAIRTNDVIQQWIAEAQRQKDRAPTTEVRSR